MSESRVRDLFANATAWNFGDHEDRPELARMREAHYAEFDSFIAKVREEAKAEIRADFVLTRANIRKIKADALREAATEMFNTDDPDAIHMLNGDADLWLKAYADRVEEEA